MGELCRGVDGCFRCSIFFFALVVMISSVFFSFGKYSSMCFFLCCRLLKLTVIFVVRVRIWGRVRSTPNADVWPRVKERGVSRGRRGGPSYVGVLGIGVVGVHRIGVGVVGVSGIGVVVWDWMGLVGLERLVVGLVSGWWCPCDWGGWCPGGLLGGVSSVWVGGVDGCFRCSIFFFA